MPSPDNTSMASSLLGSAACTLPANRDSQPLTVTASMSSAVRTLSPSTSSTSTSLSSTDPPSADDTYSLLYTGSPSQKYTKSSLLENLLAMRNDVTSENLSHTPRKCTSLPSKSQPSPSTIKTRIQHLTSLPSSTPRTESTTSKILTVGASISTTACASSLVNALSSISSKHSVSTSKAVTDSNSSSVRPLTSATCREDSLVVNISASATSSDSKFSFDLTPTSVTAIASKSPIDLTPTSVTAIASKSPIDPTPTSVIASASKSPIDPTPTLLTASASKPPVDFASTLVTAIPATFTDVSASNTLIASISTSVTAIASKSSVNLAPTSTTASSLIEASVCATDSLIASPSSSDNASASKSLEVRPSRDSNSQGSSLLGIKKSLSSSYTETSPLKHPKYEVIVNSETMENTNSINERNQVSIISPDMVPKLFRPSDDSIEPVSLSEESKYQTNWDDTSVPVKQCNFSGSSQQAVPDVAIKYPEDLVSSPSVDEVADPASNFQAQNETESVSENEISAFQPTSSPPSSHGSPITVAEALNIVQTCASITMSNVEKRSDFSRYTISHGLDRDNYFFANDVSNFLRNLPRRLKTQCKSFMLHFLDEVLIYSRRNGVLEELED